METDISKQNREEHYHRKQHHKGVGCQSICKESLKQVMASMGKSTERARDTKKEQQGAKRKLRSLYKIRKTYPSQCRHIDSNGANIEFFPTQMSETLSEFYSYTPMSCR